METTLIELMTDATIAQLIGLLIGALFFSVLGIREIADDRPEGFLLLTFGLFFAGGHCWLLFGSDSLFRLSSVWDWFVLLLAPSLVLLFSVRGVVWALLRHRREALVRIFFGLTLFAFTTMLSQGWPVDVTGVIALFYAITFGMVELHPIS